MSSITTAQTYEAIISRNGQPTGPVRLPLVDRQLFIDAFNRRYQNAGLSITGIQKPDPLQTLFNQSVRTAGDVSVDLSQDLR